MVQAAPGFEPGERGWQANTLSPTPPGDEASEFTGNSDLPTYRYARTKDTESVFQDIFD